MILAIIRPDTDSIVFNNQGSGRCDPSRIGYLPEERGMYPGKSAMDPLIYLGMLRGMKKRS
jgi:ABC-2 type transport system ATP-binding protein